MSDIYIGLMSGTSMDGIDAALVEFSKNKIELLASHSHEIPTSLKDKLQRLCQNDDSTNIDMLCETDTELGLLFADAANALLQQSSTQPKQVCAIGSHGQTIRHQPSLKNNFSLQIGDANRISYNTGITTVADFRRKDMAAGGEGAPLAPAFHQQVFYSAQENRAILNIGGIANITYLATNKNEKCFGFDTGPGNTLMDAWIAKHKKAPYDKSGIWAASATVDEKLLAHLMQDPFILKPHPKSTGREHYNLNWLEKQLNDFKHLSPAQVQSTLCQFTCDSISSAIENDLPDVTTLIICGGGVHNDELVKRLCSQLKNIKIESSEAFGVSPDWVEAIAFAWLARQTMQNLAGNIPSVTGAEKAVVLGAIYAA